MPWDIGALQVGTPDIGVLQVVPITTTEQTIDAKARIQSGAVEQTIDAAARIQTSVLKTIPAKGRIQASVDRTIPALARILRSVEQTIDATAAIRKSSEQTITAKGNLVLNVDECLNFEIYPLGYTGGWPTGFSSIGVSLPVITSGGPNTSTRFLQCFLSTFRFDRSTPIGSCSVLLNIRDIASAGHGDIDFGNYNDGTFINTTSLVNIRINEDGTGSFTSLAEVFKTSISPLHPTKWYWLQVNVEIFAQFNSSLGYDTTRVKARAFLDGEEWIEEETFDTEIPPSSLFGGLGVNRIGFRQFGIDNLCIQQLFPGVIYPNPGDPNVRVAQGYVEILELPETSNARVAQGYGEVLELPETSNLHVAQGYIELLLLETPPPDPPPDPPVPEPILGRANCVPQITVEAIPTVVPVEGIPTPPVPSVPSRFCTPQVIGQPIG